MTLTLIDVLAIAGGILLIGATAYGVLFVGAAILSAILSLPAFRSPRERICRALGELGDLDEPSLIETTGLRSVKASLDALIAGKLVALQPSPPRKGGPLYTLTKRGRNVLVKL